MRVYNTLVHLVKTCHLSVYTYIGWSLNQTLSPSHTDTSHTNKPMLKLSGASSEVNSLFVFELASDAYREQVVCVCVVAAESGLV